MVKVIVTIIPNKSNLFHGRVILRCCGIDRATATLLMLHDTFTFECATPEKAEAAIFDLTEEGFTASLEQA